jgi:soluble lytic murein transglycosylase
VSTTVRTTLGLTFLATLAIVPTPHAQQPAPNAGDATTFVLKPTNHPRLPTDLSQLWLVPPAAHGDRTEATREFISAVKLEVESDFGKALPILSRPALHQGALAGYVDYYEGFAQLRLGHAAEARKTFQVLAASVPVGYLTEAASLREAECDEALGDHAAALDVYERLSRTKTVNPDDVLMRMGRAAKAAGNSDKATEAFTRLVYEFPFSDLATAAGDELDNHSPIVAGSNRYKLELGRGERLFGAKRYAQARPIFETLHHAATGDDRELVGLRLAECDYFLKHTRQAHEALRPYVDKAARQGEALYFYAVSSRDLGDHSEYLRLVRRLVDEFASQSWAEEALNNLATHYILENDDDQADVTFREMYQRFPTGRYAERAAWKIGWRAYKNAQYPDAIGAFESASAHFPRSDYRPSWLYWSARAHGALGEASLADARYTLVATDYMNSYYGRLAVAHLDGRLPPTRPPASPDDPVAPSSEPRDEAVAQPAAVSANQTLPQNTPVVRTLLSLELYDQAIDELRYAQRVWGDSSMIQATMAWIYHQRGDFRAGINAMKRAYPQYLAIGGEKMPPDVLKVLFPVGYWSLIRQYSVERQLDPYMMAALISQESNFTADIKSPANAYGLMQILPSTGRQYAKLLHINKRFTISMLTTADTNIKMGTAYFSDLVKQFGGAHYALATYNAGPNRVARWISERPGIDRDEFIDDIPFPETQNYVKRILGQAEDYRRIYGGDLMASTENDAAPALAHAPASSSSVPARASTASTASSAKRTTASRAKTAGTSAKRSTSRSRKVKKSA